MSWMLRIEHQTTYRYGDEVSASYNEARMTPLTTDRQMTVESRVEVVPRARSYRYLDYWATVVDVFDIHVPHTTLTVTATSVVETTLSNSSGGPSSTQGLLDKISTRVPGGRLITSALVTVLLTDDGRVFAGPVNGTDLQKVAATGLAL